MLLRQVWRTAPLRVVTAPGLRCKARSIGVLVDGAFGEESADKQPRGDNAEPHHDKHKMSELLVVELERCATKQKALHGELERAKAVKDTRLKAEALVAYMHVLRSDPSLKRGQMHKVKVPCFAGDQDDYEIKVDLRKHKTLDNVVADMFRVAKKVERAPEAIQTSLDATLRTTAILQEAQGQLEEENADDNLENIAQYVHNETGLQLVPAAPKTKKKAKKAKKKSKRGKKGANMFWKFESDQGDIIWVGRNRKENEELSLKHSLGTDTWMHARGMPGSHVIVRGWRGKDKPVDQDVLQKAANLAAKHSRDGDVADRIDITVALAKHVRKPRGAPTGAVMVMEEIESLTGYPRDAPETPSSD